MIDHVIAEPVLLKARAWIEKLRAFSEELVPGLDSRAFWIASVLVGIFGLLVLKESPIPAIVIRGGLVLGLAALLVWGISDPLVPFYVLVAYLPFSRALVGDFHSHIAALNLTNVLIVWVSMTYLLRQLIRRGALWQGAPLNRLVLLFVGLCVFALLRGGFSYGAWYFWEKLIAMKRWLTPFLCYFLTLWMVQDKRTLKTVVAIMMSAVIMVASMAAWSYLTGGGGRLEHIRVGGIADEPNLLGAFFVYYMFLFLAFALSGTSGRYGWLLVMFFLVCFRGIMVTFSRGTYLAFSAGVLVISWFRSKLLFLLVALLGLLLVTHPDLLPAGVRYRFERTLVSQNTNKPTDDSPKILEPSARRRVIAWKAGLEIIKNNPWLGVGFGAFSRFVPHYSKGEAGYMDAHNSFMLIAAEMGIPALAVFLLLLGAVAFYARLLYRGSSDAVVRSMSLGFLGGVGALIAANLFNPGMVSQEIISYFWILCALVMRAGLLERGVNVGVVEVRG